jgi:hypothetical protein
MARLNITITLAIFVGATLLLGTGRSQTFTAPIAPLQAQIIPFPRVQTEHVSATPLAGVAGSFQVSVDCDRAITIASIYAKVHDPDGLIDISYISVDLVSAPFHSGPLPNAWSLDFTAHDPGPGVGSTAGYELMSHLQVDTPVGIPQNARLAILASKANFDGNETIDVGVVYFGAPDACSIVIVDN